MTDHHLSASAQTCHWGFFDAALKPVLTVRSGDRVVIDTLNGGPQDLPAAGFDILPETAAVHAGAERFHGPHILTGPVAVEGAEPGDAIEVRILDVALRQDWGFTFFKPLAGTLPDDFATTTRVFIPLDRTRMVGCPPWGGELALAPFFGVIGVAPPPAWGRITSVIPRAHGGNLDNKELVAGTSLFLPVFVAGGLVSVGDGHAVQGDGEVCVTAIETALRGTFELVLHKGVRLAGPRAETPTHLIAMGLNPDLDQCLVMALRDMIGQITSRTTLSREEAYMLSSLAVDFRITQSVNVAKGVHGLLAKAVLSGLAGRTPAPPF